MASGFKKLSVPLFLILFLLVLGAAGYFFWQWRALKNNPITAAANETQTLLDKVGELILLPDEIPTVATVTDPTKLTDQQFFANAKVGYKVLVYSNSKKAILYDPVRNMIIEVGPVKITDESGVSEKAWTDVPSSSKN